MPYFDEALDEIMDKQMAPPFDLLLGRKTYDIFAEYWPQHREEGAALNNATKYVVSRKERKLGWGPSELITGDVVSEIKKLKTQNGSMLQVYGSSYLLQTLLKKDLIDELWLKIFPVVLGDGKRLFGDGTIPMAFKLSDSKVLSSGVIIANYERAGEIETGSF